MCILGFLLISIDTLISSVSNYLNCLTSFSDLNFLLWFYPYLYCTVFTLLSAITVIFYIICFICTDFNFLLSIFYIAHFLWYWYWLIFCYISICTMHCSCCLFYFCLFMLINVNSVAVKHFGLQCLYERCYINKVYYYYYYYYYHYNI